MLICGIDRWVGVSKYVNRLWAVETGSNCRLVLFIFFCTALHPYLLGASRILYRKLRRLYLLKCSAGETDFTVSLRFNTWLLMLYIFRVTNLHTQYLTPTCCTMFSFVDYCSDMFRLSHWPSSDSSLFFSTCAAYVSPCVTDVLHIWWLNLVIYVEYQSQVDA